MDRSQPAGMKGRALSGLVAFWVACLPVAGAEFSAGQLEFFEKRVRPVLVENCHKCHSRSADKIKGGLVMDRRADLISGGESGAAIVPGKPESSRLIRAIGYGDADLQMPPRSRLKEEQIADLEAWVRRGAPWPDSDVKIADTPRDRGFDIEARRSSHWAWKPIIRPEVPPVAPSEWPLSPIDHFVLERLEEQGLKPSGPAEKHTLIRRASYAITGLPPLPEEVRRFLSDDSPRAFEKVVDRLLASPRFGERWARHWLDLVRYAETMGHEFDYSIHGAWRYRDYVIRAFNEDVPYNLFVKEHIAGDLLDTPRRHPTEGFNESIIGTSFYWFPQQKHSPVDIKQEQADLIDNQIDVLTKTFLGLTVACARCHDHKFDAISTRDFYSLYGVLESSRYNHSIIDEPAGFRAAKSRLAGLRERLDSEVKRVWREELAELGEHVVAAAELMRREPGETQSPDNATVFEDFEDSLGEGWEATGDAFAGPLTQKEIGRHQGDLKARGNRFLNSHNARVDKQIVHSDRFTGTLTSPEFAIGHSYIHFLVGGGAHEGKTCVNLLVEGEAVRTATGRNKNEMAPHVWDVRNLQGRPAHIEVVDDVRGGWGNIGLDHIVFSNEPGYFAPADPTVPAASAILELAGKKGLDASFLRRCVKALSEAGHDDPLASLRGFLNTGREQVHDRNPREGDEVFVDFARQGLNGWFPRGHAFPAAPSKGGELVVRTTESGPEARMLSAGWLDSGALSPRLQGVLRSPTFTIDKPFMHLRVAGNGTRINIVIDNFTLIRNPIYGGLRHDVNHPEPHWIRVDVSMWQGRRCYFEFADTTARDPAGKSYPEEAFIALRRIVFSEHSEPPTEGVASPDRPGDSIEEVVEAVVARCGRALDGQAHETGVMMVNRLLETGLLSSPADVSPVRSLLDEWSRVTKEIPEARMVAGMTEGTPVNEHIFVRGSHRTPGRIAQRSFLEALSDLHPKPFTQGSGRLELAECIVHPDNPLTARVIVNRLWHHLFGRGIVPTTDDFGVLGRPPSHPRLLDWLAVRLRENDWSLKETIREITLSRTYQMSSQPVDPAAEKSDPDNVWLHRMRVTRLEGEAIRDAMLAVSGRLDDSMYGPSVPIHLTPFMEGRGRPGESGPLDGDGRRSIYLEVRRNFLLPMMLAFDAPLPATTIGRRSVSNVPAQALILMNDPFVAGQARAWAERLLAVDAGDEDRLRLAYQQAFARHPSPEELQQGLAFLREQQGRAAMDAWGDLCHVLFNVKEFVFVN